MKQDLYFKHCSQDVPQHNRYKATKILMATKLNF